MHADARHGTDMLAEWLATPIGTALIEQERLVVGEALDGIFGEECLQLGLWSEARTFLPLCRTQRAYSMAPAVVGDQKPDVIADLHRLPVASDSIDAVFLPHTLEFSAKPHAILREVHRVMRSDGHLVVLGFKTGGLWGVRRLIPGAGFPPGAEQLLSDRRLRDWLDLLDLRIHGLTRYFFRWPLPGNGGACAKSWEQRGQRFWPELGACYMLTAQKRVRPLTPVKRPVWRSRPKVVAGLVKPSPRVSPIRIDEKR